MTSRKFDGPSYDVYVVDSGVPLTKTRRIESGYREYLTDYQVTPRSVVRSEWSYVEEKESLKPKNPLTIDVYSFVFVHLFEK